MEKYAEAEKVDLQVLNKRNKILGEEYPDTTTALENLASTYQYLGKYTDVDKLQIQLLDVRTRILGGEHPDTITAIAQLAAT